VQHVGNLARRHRGRHDGSDASAGPRRKHDDNDQRVTSRRVANFDRHADGVSGDGACSTSGALPVAIAVATTAATRAPPPAGRTTTATSA